LIKIREFKLYPLGPRKNINLSSQEVKDY
jgi:hypothetical protein